MAQRAERLEAFRSASWPVITPSLLSCDFLRVGEEIAALERAGVVGLHLDVMDGHFVPNLSFGPPVIQAWRKATDLPFDTHLMMSNPAPYLDAFANAGADTLLVQIEAVPHPRDVLRRIRGLGCWAGLVINPPTPLDLLMPHLDEVDCVLVMSVMPGFGGQEFQPEVLEKVRALRAARPKLWISIDGGVNAKTAGAAVSAGANQLVVGSATFRPDGNYAAALAMVAEAACRGVP